MIDAPDALGGVERQQPFVTLGKGAHHRGLAARAEGRAGFGGLLDRDQPVDDLAARHQEAVHGLVDAVDLGAKLGKGGRLVGHSSSLSKMGRPP